MTAMCTPPALIKRLTLHGNVYLDPLKEEALLRGRLGHHELSVARAVLPQFVRRFGGALRTDEADLLDAWGHGKGFRWLLDVFDGAELFVVGSDGAQG